jgi:HlyD family secretion protein
MKAIASVVIVAVVTGLVGAHYYWYGGTGRPSFRTLPVTRGDLSINFTTTGFVEPVETIDVGAQIVGSIKSLGPDPDRPGKTVDYRSRVKAGMVLAQLDDLPHRAEVEKARATLRLAEADLNHYRARQKQTERDFKRAEQLRDTDSAAQYENAMAEMEIAKADMAMSEAKVEQAKITLKQAEINLSYTTISAPIDGVVIDRKVNVGQTVVAGMNAPSLFLLARDLSHMQVWAAVNEADIGDVKIGQTVTFKVDAYRDRTFSGKVSQIRLNAGLQQNVVTYGVVVDVENPDGKLLPYMTARLEFDMARRSNVLRVPNQALRWRPTWEQITPSARTGLKSPTLAAAGQDAPEGTSEETEPKVDVGSPAVWKIAEDGLVRPVFVKVGLSDGIMTEIIGKELKPGIELATNVIQEAKPDFVSSFISKVTDSKP